MTTTCLRRSLCGKTWFVRSCVWEVEHCRIVFVSVCRRQYPIRLSFTFIIFVVYYVVENGNHHCVHQAFDDVVGFKHIIAARTTAKHQVSVIIIIIIVMSTGEEYFAAMRAPALASNRIQQKNGKHENKNQFSHMILNSMQLVSCDRSMRFSIGRTHCHDTCTCSKLISWRAKWFGTTEDQTDNKLGFNCFVVNARICFWVSLHSASMCVACLLIHVVLPNSAAELKGLNAMSFIKLIGQTK